MRNCNEIPIQIEQENKNDIIEIYTEYQLTEQGKERLFSKVGMEIISEIEQYGYKVHYIKEFLSAQIVKDDKGQIFSVATPDALGATLPKNRAVVFSKKSVDRARRRYHYYNAIISDPERLKAWKRKNAGSYMVVIPVYWPELLIHELAHVIIIEKKHRSYVKWEVLNEFYQDEFSKSSPDRQLLSHLERNMVALLHGSDFGRTYNSLCRKYGIKPERKENGQVRKHESNR